MALVSGLIIFLTGCASRGYHSPYGSTPPSGSSADLTQGYGVSSGLYPRFAWPLRGQVIVPFGGKEDGVSSKGIVIESKEGERVLAAEDGRVVLVDEKLKGYGKTIIIEHANNLSTVYARNATILVQVGESVKRGDLIAKVGRAGRGFSPQLYFEIRKKAKAEDPRFYLPL